MPKYSLTYPVENIETANTDIDITRMKNADSLSTKKPYIIGDGPPREKINVSPSSTEIEKITPDKDATDALKNDA